MVTTNQYDETSIQVLKGLEPVRQRPGMYTRTDSPLHILQEVIDNATDEALAGDCTQIQVTWHADDSLSVDDDGRGIPTGNHPEEKVPVVELVFTQLHAGGKFNKQKGSAYAFSGGLHGVGVSVTNALSKRLEVIVWRHNKAHRIVFENGNVVEPLKPYGKADSKKSGTRVRIWPNPQYFDHPYIAIGELTALLRSKAVLLPGIRVLLKLEKSGETQSWHYEDGLRSYLEEALEGNEPLIPLFVGEQYAGTEHDSFAQGEGAKWAIGWTENNSLLRESYVNLIPTPAGGTHEAGLREGLFAAVKHFVELHALLPKGIKLLPEDVFARASFILSVKVLDPQFQGQIKERLNSRDAVRLVGGFVKSALDLWLHSNVEYGKKLAELAIFQAQARTRSSQKIQKRKSSGVAILPGKLTDCESTDLTRTEVFLVEGDSAGGSAKMGRDKEYQAILPLRGKVLNAWEVQRDRLFANNEIHDISVAIGVDPHSTKDQPDLSGLRYGRICILSDADVDGLHIQVLLLTLFYRHFPKLIEKGHVFVARPPLFRLDVPAAGKRPARKIYCLEQGELQAVQDKLQKEGIRAASWSVSRFKGLGEMSAEQLWETTMNPDTRRLLPVGYGTLNPSQTTNMFNMLMSKSESAQRRAWIEEKGNLAECDI